MAMKFMYDDGGLADGKIAGVSKRCVYGYWTLN